MEAENHAILILAADGKSGQLHVLAALPPMKQPPQCALLRKMFFFGGGVQIQLQLLRFESLAYPLTSKLH
jgi:hypothetical protein